MCVPGLAVLDVLLSRLVHLLILLVVRARVCEKLELERDWRSIRRLGRRRRQLDLLPLGVRRHALDNHVFPRLVRHAVDRGLPERLNPISGIGVLAALALRALGALCARARVAVEERAEGRGEASVGAARVEVVLFLDVGLVLPPLDREVRLLEDRFVGGGARLVDARVVGGVGADEAFQFRYQRLKRGSQRKRDSPAPPLGMLARYGWSLSKMYGWTLIAECEPSEVLARTGRDQP